MWSGCSCSQDDNVFFGTESWTTTISSLLEVLKAKLILNGHRVNPFSKFPKRSRGIFRCVYLLLTSCSSWLTGSLLQPQSPSEPWKCWLCHFLLVSSVLVLLGLFIFVHRNIYKLSSHFRQMSENQTITYHHGKPSGLCHPPSSMLSPPFQDGPAYRLSGQKNQFAAYIFKKLNF